IARAAAVYGQRPAIIHGALRQDWEQTYRRTRRLASALQRLGIGKNDTVSAMLPNTPAMVEAHFGVPMAGAVLNALNIRLDAESIVFMLRHGEAKVLLIDSEFAALAQQLRTQLPALKIVEVFDVLGPPPVPGERFGHLEYEALLADGDENFEWQWPADEWDAIALNYTSGTTGHPKAGMLSHGQMAFVVTNHLADLMPGLTHQSRSLVVAPLSHGAGVHAVVNTARGAASILLSSERLVVEEAWQLVEKYKVDNLFTVPTIVKILVEDESVDRYDHSSLKHVIYAGAPMYRADQIHALKKLGKVLVQYYGLGEVTGNITFLPPYLHFEDDAHPQARVGTCGMPRTGMQVAI
ncbi:UNVERIFIED_CONTAM: AMP-binding protein, partial [Streptococcus suis]